MYIIKKEVFGCKYFWNDVKEQWEGLLYNATPVGAIRLEALMGDFLASYDADCYSFSKIIEC